MVFIGLHDGGTNGAVAAISEKDMMHGREWDGVADLTGWRITEKLDGCRLYWDGAVAWTRTGRQIQLPAHWSMPTVALDCELWAGRGRYQVARNAINHGDWSDPQLCLRIFEAPTCSPDYCPEGFPHLARVPDLGVVESKDALRVLLRGIQTNGGEGIMARNPALNYHAGRTKLLLKVL